MTTLPLVIIQLIPQTRITKRRTTPNKRTHLFSPLHSPWGPKPSANSVKTSETDACISIRCRTKQRADHRQHPDTEQDRQRRRARRKWCRDVQGREDREEAFGTFFFLIFFLFLDAAQITRERAEILLSCSAVRRNAGTRSASGAPASLRPLRSAPSSAMPPSPPPPSTWLPARGLSERGGVHDLSRRPSQYREGEGREGIPRGVPSAPVTPLRPRLREDAWPCPQWKSLLSL